MSAPRRLLGLQIAVGLAGLVPVGAGLAGVLQGVGMLGGPLPGGPLLGGPLLGGPAALGLDSHFRYLSGLLLGIGLLFWGMIPGIARHTRAFRLLTAVVVVGGLGRLYGVLVVGLPPGGMGAALGMELVVTPLLCLWQGRMAQPSPSTSVMP